MSPSSVPRRWALEVLENINGDQSILYKVVFPAPFTTLLSYHAFIIFLALYNTLL